MSTVSTTVFRLASEHGYRNDVDLARAMGISVAQVNRVRRGLRGVSKSFITGALRAFPDKRFDDLFSIDPEREKEAVA